MFDMMYNSENSLVEQSKSAKKRRLPVNADGFGLGWYPVHDDPEPGVYVSTKPAWSDQNLRSLCSKISTSCFFAHVRDASLGMPVSAANCHPFRYGNFLWMHNGELGEFNQIKRRLIEMLSERAFLQISGNTDSEYAFALFLDEINFNDKASHNEIENALYKTLLKINEIKKACHVQSHSLMNFVVSNGHCLISTRFSTNTQYQPPSLFYTTANLSMDKNNHLFLSQNEVKRSVIVASEPITLKKDTWHKIERNNMIMVDEQLNIQIKDILI